ncbi:transcriptional repressor [Candidatus Vecturithrix granuli]|uniref:Transcriptional repressor n=1 Tax=Vecturithrix granuli TaxID=1499967 RepID=A0A0S6WBG1_VECG1|nr:transcriptional repressor [Candidatus Vecturithrix granuli]
MKIDANNSAPKYLQLKEIIIRYFHGKQYETDQKIPSETELMNQFNVSRNTVRQALAELVNEGFIYKKHGSGSFFSGKTGEEESHSYLIGVITPFISSYIYPQIIQGIDDVAHERRYNIVLGSSKGELAKERNCLEQLLEKNIEGLLIEPAGGFHCIQESETFNTVRTLSIPVVFMDWEIDDPDISYVSLNDREGGFRAASYLAQAGHTRIACVYPDDHIPGIHRYEGYKKAIETYRLTYDETLVRATTIEKWNQASHIIALTKNLLELGEQRPSAIFFFNDNAALRAYIAIRAAGLRIPEDISIMGFDDSELATLTDAPLTTMIHPKYQLGKWAAEMLFEDIAHKDHRTPRQLLINPTIAIRNSVKVIESINV